MRLTVYAKSHFITWVQFERFRTNKKTWKSLSFSSFSSISPASMLNPRTKRVITRPSSNKSHFPGSRSRKLPNKTVDKMSSHLSGIGREWWSCLLPLCTLSLRVENGSEFLSLFYIHLDVFVYMAYKLLRPSRLLIIVEPICIRSASQTRNVKNILDETDYSRHILATWRRN